MVFASQKTPIPPPGDLLAKREQALKKGTLVESAIMDRNPLHISCPHCGRLLYSVKARTFANPRNEEVFHGGCDPVHGVPAEPLKGERHLFAEEPGHSPTEHGQQILYKTFVEYGHCRGDEETYYAARVAFIKEDPERPETTNTLLFLEPMTAVQNYHCSYQGQQWVMVVWKSNAGQLIEHRLPLIAEKKNDLVTDIERVFARQMNQIWPVLRRS